MNKTLLVGNLTADARINVVNETTDAVSFTVATNDGYKGTDGAWVDQVEYHDCTRFVNTGKGAKLHEMLTKGRQVEVEGSLKKSAPRTGSDSKVYHNYFIRVDEVKLGQKPAVREEVPAE
jgi:single stranded DNA-binding protein